MIERSKARKRPHDIFLIFLDKGFPGVFLSAGKFLGWLQNPKPPTRENARNFSVWLRPKGRDVLPFDCKMG